MNRLRLLLTSAIVACGMVVLPAGRASADPIGGTLLFDNGGTLTGFFDFDPAATDPLHSIVSWNLTSTAFGSTHVYDSANTAAGASSIVLSNANSDQVFAFFQVFADGPVQSTFELDIVLGCGGTANCFTNAAQNMSFAIVGQHTCAGTGLCVSSGEQRPNAFGQQFLNNGFINVSDPPGTLAFNVASAIEPGYTLYTGGTGGGTDPGVPEPSSLLLLGTGLAGLVGRFSRRHHRNTN